MDGAVLLLIWPLSRGVDRTRKEIAAIEDRNKNQETLAPVYQEMARLNEDLQAALAEIEAAGSAPFLTEPDIQRLPESFRAAMARAGMNLETCVPDLASITRGEKSFSLDLGFAGDSKNLPQWLSLPEAAKGVAELRRMEIAQKTAKQYGMTLWVDMDR